MRFSWRRLVATAAVAAVAAPGIVAAADLPANLRIDGVIAPGAGAQRVAPAQNDKVLVINVATGALEAIGEVVDGNGNYFVMIGKDASFNNTALTMQLQKSDQTVYQLLNQGRTANFNFKGSLFPSRLNLQLSLGSPLGAPSAAAKAAAPQPTPSAPQSSGDKCDDPRMDVNGDGVCDEKDIEIIKAYVAGQVRTIGSGPRLEDVNRDGVVNSRDLIDAMRAIRKQPAKPAAQ